MSSDYLKPPLPANSSRGQLATNDMGRIVERITLLHILRVLSWPSLRDSSAENDP